MVKRWLFRGVVCLVALCAVSCDWSHFRGGGALRGVSSDTAFTTANVGTIVEQWRTAGPPTGSVESPTVSGGRVYTSVGAYDAAGVTNCAGAPKVCAPLWSIQPFPTGSLAVPTEANGTQFVVPKSSYDALRAFDANGETGCSGTPVVCAPMWTGSTGAPPSPVFGNGIAGLASPVVVDGRLYAADYGAAYALDANGVQNCGGTPKVCTPLFKMVGAAPISPLAVADGTVFIQSGHSTVSGYTGGLYAFDAAGSVNCGGGTCAPLWRGDFGLAPNAANGNSPFTTPIANGVVYATATSASKVMAFDQAGSINCAGSPKVCQPLWTATLPPNADVSSGFIATAVAGGRLYVPIDSGVLVYDAAGATNCSGTPKTCTPLATFSYGGSPGTTGGVTVANGVAFVGTRNGLLAFDAAAATNCTGTPAVCTPLVHVLAGSAVSSPVVHRGRLHVLSQQQLVTLALP